MTKPIGFDNFKTFSFVSNDGSGFTFFRKASFTLTETGLHYVFAGPSIAAMSASSARTIATSPSWRMESFRGPTSRIPVR